MCHRRSAPLAARRASRVSSAARARSASIITLRRSWRSLTTPPKRSRAIRGTVMAIPSSDSAAGAFDSVYACQARATRNAPSPSSDTERPAKSRRKSPLARANPGCGRGVGRDARRTEGLSRIGRLSFALRRVAGGRRRGGGLLAGAGGGSRQIAAEIPRLHRMGEVEALAELAAEVAQPAKLLIELDTLGDDLQVERAAERHNRAREVEGLL